ncbi:hypothetical protein FE782_08220 [Paenibacillus antri]|uniref:Uncharacterized protein n=1 Tax=Paenibacillus antri TaxID=2582848 RepID=A0A5R9G883_9BACL|nr:DUF5696 domain-containing protein [Paenibacillus antri]TLS52612.1 hypothetical protein FE782_08220 [Paenibacillus antri]
MRSMSRLKSGLRTHAWKIAGYAVTAALTIAFILVISEPPAEPAAPAAAAVEEPKPELNEFGAPDLSLENERFRLRFDGRYGGVTVTDKATGETWVSIPAIDETMPPNNQRFIRSPVHIRYTEGKGSAQTYPFKEQGALQAKLSDAGDAIVAAFDLPTLGMSFVMEYRLTDDGLEIVIPFDSIRDGVDKKLVSIEPLPFFEAAAGTERGAVVIPDGSGAIIPFKESHPPYFEIYSEFIYGGDHAFRKNVYQKVTDNERELLSYGPREMAALPIYGIYKEGDKAFLAVVQDGAEDAKINATPSGLRGIQLYRTSAEFIYRNDDVVFLGSSGEIPLTLSDMIPGDRSIRYVFLQGDAADYVGMASAYRKYLTTVQGVVPVEGQSPAYQLRLFGGVLQDEILGRTFISMTTFDEARRMLEGLIERGVRSIELTLEGWNDGGAFGNQPAHLPADRRLGGTADLKALADYAASQGIDLYLKTNYVKPFHKSRAMKESSDAIRGLNKELMKVYKPYVTTRQASYELYYLLKADRVSERYVEKEMPAFAELGATGVQLGLMGSMLYSDPGSKTPTYRKTTLDAWVRSMDAAREHAGKAAVDYGFGYALGHVDRIDDIPLDSSHFLFEERAIPFYQIAVHGMIPYTAKPSNLRDDPKAEFLRALEYGALPSFRFTHEDPAMLKRTMVDDLFSSRFSEWADLSVREYNEAAAVLEQVAGEPIVAHERLAEGVFRTTYGNGVQVIVNYNSKETSADGATVPALGYAVKGGAQ